MGENLRDYYTQQNLYDLLGYKQRIQIIRWLKKCKREGYPIRVLKICGKKGTGVGLNRPLYWRNDVDAWLDSQASSSGDPLYKWNLMKRKLALPIIDLDLDEWIPFCQASKLWWIHDTPDRLYRVSRTHTSLVNVRSRWVDFGHNSRQLFFKKQDVIALQERMAKYYENAGN